MRSRSVQWFIDSLTGVLFLVSGGGGMILGTGNPAMAEDFAGVTVNLVTVNLPVTQEPVRRRAAEFERLTGVQINVLQQSLDLDVLTHGFSTGQYDAAVYGAWWPELADAGILEDLTERVAQDSALAWQDIIPFFRNFLAAYQGRIYAIPLSGHVHMLFYRADLLAQAGLDPPKTWNDYLEVAQRFHGQDLNGDGEPDFGSCLTKNAAPPSGTAAWLLLSVAAPFLQTEGTSQGMLFDPHDLKPLMNNEAFETALRIFVETGRYGPPNEHDLPLFDDMRLFIQGRCALTVGWGDIAVMSLTPESKIRNKWGVALTPGSRGVLNLETGTLTACDSTRCPYAKEGVNYAPFAAFTGWAGIINTYSPIRVKDAAYAFLSYMSQPPQSNVDVTKGNSFNPYRASQFTTMTPWRNAGMTTRETAAYLEGIGKTLTNPNMVLDMLNSERFPQSLYYWDELRSALDRVLAQEITATEAVRELEQAWEQITEKAGREQQRQAYLRTLGRQVK